MSTDATMTVDTPTTARSERFWADPRQDEMPGLIETYRKSATAPYRRVFLDALQALAPFDTVLELGCHCGPLAEAILADFPHVAYTGVDINASAIAAARQVFDDGQYDVGVAFIHANARTFIASAASNGYDVVVASSVLCTMDVETARATLREMARAARIGVVLQEPSLTPGRVPVRQNGDFVEWRHDYVAMCQALGLACVAKDETYIITASAVGDAVEDAQPEPNVTAKLREGVGPIRRTIYPHVDDPSTVPPLAQLFVDPPLRSRRIAIVGFSDSTRDQAPYNDPDVEIWSVNQTSFLIPRCDRICEPHDRATIEAENAALKRVANYLGFLQAERQRPIYTHEPLPADLPTAIRLPLERFVAEFGAHCEKLKTEAYATSAFGFLFGLAILKLLDARADRNTPTGDEWIGLFGIDLTVDGEWADQRPNAEFFGAYALAKGIAVYVPTQSAIFSSDGPYCQPGRGERQVALRELRTFYQRRHAEIAAKVAALEQQKRDTDRELCAAMGMKNQCEWSLSHLAEVLRGSAIHH